MLMTNLLSWQAIPGLLPDTLEFVSQHRKGINITLVTDKVHMLFRVVLVIV